MLAGYKTKAFAKRTENKAKQEAIECTDTTKSSVSPLLQRK